MPYCSSMRAVCIALAILLGVSTAYAEQIKEIQVEENTKTDDETVR